MKSILFSLAMCLVVVGNFGFVETSLREAQEEEDECPCKAIEELTQKDLLCMNSCAKIYSCITGIDVKPEEVYSYECTLYTGEETILRRYDKDELALVVKNNILKAKKIVIRGVRLKNDDGKPSGRYLRTRAKIKFSKHKDYIN